MAEKMFRVEVAGDLDPYRADDKVVVFHGINKSGSMCLANVFRVAYIAASRGEQFYCHYHRGREEWNDLLLRVKNATGHKLFISHNFYGAIKPRPGQVFATMFRYPLPRIVSGYQWLKNRFVENGGRPDDFQSLEEFVEKRNGIGWSQIAQFGIGGDRQARRGKWTHSPEETYQRCVENIVRDVSWFGIAELFEETIFVFAAICGIPRVPAWKRDVRNPGRALTRELTEAQREMIRYHYRYDFELYDQMLGIFRERLERLQIKGDIALYKSVCAPEYKERPLEEAAGK